MKIFFAINSVFLTLAGLCLLALLIPITAHAQQDIQDIDLTVAVTNELQRDPAISSHLIDIQTNDGVVTLSGSVDNILSRDMAVRITESIKGVRSVINQIKIKPVIRTDEQLVKDVQQALVANPVTESYEVGVRSLDGIVTLTGTVDSWTEKQMVARVTKGIKGVKDINNNVSIRYTDERPDSEIKAEIEQRLRMDPYVDDGLIVVNVKDGEVKLSGTIGSVAEKSDAYADAWVLGVTDVKNNLDIKWWLRDKMKREDKFARISDTEIKKAVKDALLYDPRTLSFKIDVDVKDGIVTLNGTVDNLTAKTAAESDAKNTAGVLIVNNFLKVRPDNPPIDAQIAENIRDALTRNPLIDRFDISVAVLNQKAYLYGTVDTYYDKNLAYSVASSVFGVVDITNNIDVRPIVWMWKPDETIKQNIENEFFWSLFVDGDDITVSVDEGIATLRGSVDDWGEYYDAVENAFEGGAQTVETHLNIGPSGMFDGYYEYPPT